MGRAAWYVLVISVLVGVGFGLGIYTGPTLRRYVQPQTGLTGTNPVPPLAVAALGRLRPEGGIVNVMGLPGDRVARVLKRQGDRVEPTDPVIELASLADRTAEVRLASQQLEDAKNQRKNIVESSKAKLAEVVQQREAARTNRDLEERRLDLQIRQLTRQRDAARTQNDALRAVDSNLVYVSNQEREKSRLAVSQAQAELDSAEATRRAAVTRYELQLESIANQEKVVQSETKLSLDRLPLESLQQQITLAQLRENRSRLMATVSGTVLKVSAAVGDSVGPEPLVQIAPDAPMQVIAEVDARSIPVLRGWLKEKRVVEATITSQAVPDLKLKGTVRDEKAISASVARNSVTGFSPRADNDRRIVEVRIELDKEGQKTARDYIGLEIDVILAPRGTGASEPKP